MINPRVEINIDKVRSNTSYIVNLCLNAGIDVAGVTKALSGNKDIARAMAEGGVKYLADSRIQNIISLKEINVPKMLLRIPMISEIEEVVRFCDMSLNSELDTITKISYEAIKQCRTHKIILMIDLGDLREGVWYRDYDKTVEKILLLKGIELAGIGTNLTCWGGVIPSNKNLNILCDIASSIRKKYGIELPIVSGGNSSSLYLIGEGEMPRGINNLRIGEAILLGRETAFGRKIHNLYDDAFIFYSELIEVKQKPSYPVGNIGIDAFGNLPEISDRGIRHRAIAAAGRQDIMYQNMTPLDECMEIIGASSDHLLLDITECKKKYSVGDEIPFKMAYGCLLRAMTSPYVTKEILDGK